MDMFEQLRWAVAHDPCRHDDRSPFGAVPVGSAVQVRLRVDETCRALVISADALVLEGGTWRSVRLEADAGGFSGMLSLEQVPHVAFYAFELALERNERLFYVPRLDGRSSAGELVVPGHDGNWTESGWSYSAEKWARRPAGDVGLPEIMPGFQITVYDASFDTPRWLGGAVMYQIFPDRFARGSAGVREGGLAYHRHMDRPVALHENWDEPPRWTGEARGGPGGQNPSIEERMAAYDPVDFFGGTLDGIREKLGYLTSLGVSVLYLNPVFEARSNHRYDTADYERVDPLLGDEQSLARLVEAARAHGIAIVLDAVLSHTGFDSRYFNGNASYDGPGAAQGPASPYFPWYDFGSGEDGAGYRCWWGDPTLPEVDEREPTWQRYMLGGAGSQLPGGVLGKWLSVGVRGFRLDVADEIPDDVLERIRSCVKGHDAHAAIIGEVWEDPTTKHSYGSARAYALGGALDSVMNYPLRSALISFALGSIDAQQLTTLFKHQQANYPEPMYRCLMNLVSSHDVERVRTVLSLGRSVRHVPRNEQVAAVARITDSEDERASALQRMIAGLLYALPGTPCLYYGDERGMQGGADPFCRATFPQDGGMRRDCGRDLTAFYRDMGMLRKQTAALNGGEVAFFAAHEDVACVVRWHPDEQGAIIAVANRSRRARRIVVDLRESTPFDDVVALDALACSTTFYHVGDAEATSPYGNEARASTFGELSCEQVYPDGKEASL